MLNVEGRKRNRPPVWRPGHIHNDPKPNDRVLFRHDRDLKRWESMEKTWHGRAPSSQSDPMPSKPYFNNFCHTGLQQNVKLIVGFDPRP